MPDGDENPALQLEGALHESVTKDHEATSEKYNTPAVATVKQ